LPHFPSTTTGRHLSIWLVRQGAAVEEHHVPRPLQRAGTRGKIVEVADHAPHYYLAKSRIFPLVPLLDPSYGNAPPCSGEAWYTVGCAGAQGAPDNARTIAHALYQIVSTCG
jgi:hypothetical protein